jgi:hypothetical protein
MVTVPEPIIGEAVKASWGRMVKSAIEELQTRPQLPSGVSAGQLLRWNGSAWQASSVLPLPTVQQVGHMIQWNGSAWVSVPGLPSPSAAQSGSIPQWDGSKWLVGSISAPAPGSLLPPVPATADLFLRTTGVAGTSGWAGVSHPSQVSQSARGTSQTLAPSENAVRLALEALDAAAMGLPPFEMKYLSKNELLLTSPTSFTDLPGYEVQIRNPHPTRRMSVQIHWTGWAHVAGSASVNGTIDATRGNEVVVYAEPRVVSGGVALSSKQARTARPGAGGAVIADFTSWVFASVEPGATLIVRGCTWGDPVGGTGPTLDPGYRAVQYCRLTAVPIGYFQSTATRDGAAPAYQPIEETTDADYTDPNAVEATP